jgi:hypothetical protein
MQWNLSPLNSINNINNLGNVPRVEVQTLQHPELTQVQDRMVQKILLELNEFDNLYFEVCNEPYFASVTKEWQDHIIKTIVNTEEQLGTRHMIAQNFANGSMQIEDPNPHLSIFNFHYAIPDAALLNYGFNKAIGDDETGFAGTADAAYRIEGWNFFLAGGATLNHLDYSFTTDHENGTYQFPKTQPGGGGAALRSQFKILHDFIAGFNFIKMKPSPDVIKGGLLENIIGQVLAEHNKAYAAYFAKKQGNRVDFSGSLAALFPSSELKENPPQPVMDLPAGKYNIEWIDTLTGNITKSEKINHPGGNLTLQPPAFDVDIALRMIRI